MERRNFSYSEVLRRSGVSSKKFRSYKQAGLLVSVSVANNPRSYPPETLHWLLVIAWLEQTCLPLEDIRSIFIGQISWQQATAFIKAENPYLQQAQRMLEILGFPF